MIEARRELIRDIAKLRGQVYTAEGKKIFMSTPLPELNGRTPRDAVTSCDLEDLRRLRGALITDAEGGLGR